MNVIVRLRDFTFNLLADVSQRGKLEFLLDVKRGSIGESLARGPAPALPAVRHVTVAHCLIRNGRVATVRHVRSHSARHSPHFRLGGANVLHGGWIFPRVLHDTAAGDWGVGISATKPRVAARQKRTPPRFEPLGSTRRLAAAAAPDHLIDIFAPTLGHNIDGFVLPGVLEVLVVLLILLLEQEVLLLWGEAERVHECVALEVDA